MTLRDELLGIGDERLREFVPHFLFRYFSNDIPGTEDDTVRLAETFPLLNIIPGALEKQLQVLGYSEAEAHFSAIGAALALGIVVEFAEMQDMPSAE